MTPTAFPVLFIDAEAIVIDKPRGLPVDPPRRGGASLTASLDALTFGFQRLPVPVHRLDTDTSGCLLLARTPRALRSFQAAFEQRAVTKTYWSVVAGEPDGDSGVIDMALGKISSAEAGWRMVPDPRGKDAVTAWRVLARRKDRTLVELTPATGRTHQLRVHMASGLGLPIVGDPVYAHAPDGCLPARAGPMLLHARALSVPREGKPAIVARAPLPADFVAAGWSEADGDAARAGSGD